MDISKIAEVVEALDERCIRREDFEALQSEVDALKKQLASMPVRVASDIARSAAR